jgi:hypothetical protein
MMRRICVMRGVFEGTHLSSCLLFVEVLGTY